MNISEDIHRAVVDALKGRATTTYPALQVLVDVPNEIAWNILSFWNVAVPWD